MGSSVWAGWRTVNPGPVPTDGRAGQDGKPTPEETPLLGLTGRKARSSAPVGIAAAPTRQPGLNFLAEPTTFLAMHKEPPVLEMTIEGDFVTPPQPPRPPFGTRVLIWAAVVAAVAVSLAVAVFALWLLAFLIPVALIAALIAYGVFRYQLWRHGGSIPGGTILWVRRR